MNTISNQFSFLLSGGFMMYPLLLSGLVALTLIIERLYVLKFKFATDPQVIARILADLRVRGAGTELSETEKLAATPTGNILVKGVSEFPVPIGELEILMQNQAEAWLPVIERRLDILDTIITAAPLMGLLGTITGMMASFHVLSTNGVNEPNAITGGVAEALIATATGLVIALFSLVAFNYFNNQVKVLVSEMEAVGAKILEIRRKVLRPVS